MNNILINRKIEATIREHFNTFPIVTLTGPRQSGKTTLCRKLFPEFPYVNFEDATILDEVKSDPKRFINKYPQGLIIDEAHNFPEIFSYIQVVVDEDNFNNKTDRRFIITGSSNFALLEKVTQSLAGRTAVLNLLPLSLQELNDEQQQLSSDTHILRGGYPAIWAKGQDSRMVYRAYYNTYVERDVRSIINVKDMNAFNKFIKLCAGRVGTEFKASILSGEIGVSVPTINQWLSVLEASYIVYLLPPFYENIKKRLVKTPKLYFYDTGLATYLLSIENETQLSTHPLRGALFENMVVNEMMKERINQGKDPNLYFYRDQSQREIDVIRTNANYLEAYEIKSGMSYNSDYYKWINYFKKLMDGRVTRSAVIYDGQSENDYKDNGLYNFRNFRLDE